MSFNFAHNLHLISRQLSRQLVLEGGDGLSDGDGWWWVVMCGDGWCFCVVGGFNV